MIPISPFGTGHLSTAFAGSDVFVWSIAKLSALCVNHLMILSAARHIGMYSGCCKLTTAHFDIWS